MSLTCNYIANALKHNWIISGFILSFPPSTIPNIVETKSSHTKSVENVSWTFSIQSF